MLWPSSSWRMRSSPSSSELLHFASCMLGCKIGVIACGCVCIGTRCFIAKTVQSLWCCDGIGARHREFEIPLSLWKNDQSVQDMHWHTGKCSCAIARLTLERGCTFAQAKQGLTQHTHFLFLRHLCLTTFPTRSQPPPNPHAPSQQHIVIPLQPAHCALPTSKSLCLVYPQHASEHSMWVAMLCLTCDAFIFQKNNNVSTQCDQTCLRKSISVIMFCKFHKLSSCSTA